MALGYMTVFRREMSCNSDYHKVHDHDIHHNNNNNNNNNNNSNSNNNKNNNSRSRSRGRGTNNTGNDTDNSTSNHSIKHDDKEEESKKSKHDSFIKRKNIKVKESNNNNNNINNPFTKWKELKPQQGIIGATISSLSTSSLSSFSNSYSLATKKSVQIRKTKPKPQQPLLFELTSSLQMHCFMFLHPRDLSSFSCCNTVSRCLIDGAQITPSMQQHQQQQQNNEEIIVVRKGEKEPTFSDILWLKIFKRDYAWTLTSWNVGKDAIQRSLKHLQQHANGKHNHNNNDDDDDDDETIETSFSCSIPNVLRSTIIPPSYHHHCHHREERQQSTISMKEFYFTFAQTWINYTIAGLSSNQACYTSIHGHIFNITNFLPLHPGSLETLLLQGGGRDCTSFFESVGHSTIARKIAVKNLVEVVDLSCCSRLGVNRDGGCDEITFKVKDKDQQQQQKERERRKQYSSNESVSTSNARTGTITIWPLCGLKPKLDNEMCLLPRHRSRPTRKTGTLICMQQKIERDEKRAKVAASNTTIHDKIGDVHVYFDPICNQWFGWYLNDSFDTMFFPTGISSEIE